MSFQPSPQFVNDLKEWDKVNSLIKQYEGNLKDLRQEKKKLQDSTIVYMTENELDVCNLQDGKIHLKKNRRKVSVMTKKSLPEKIAEFFVEKRNMDPNMAQKHAEEIVEFVDSKATYVESSSLTRTKKRNAGEM
jgi:hypothetical protein